MGGTMRLGADPVKLHDGTRAREIYDEPVIYERHRHRYEVNNHLRKRLEHAGLVCSRHLARRPAGRGHRAARPPVLRRLAVPPRVQVAAAAPAAAVPRLRRARRSSARGSAAPEVEPASRGAETERRGSRRRSRPAASTVRAGERLPPSASACSTTSSASARSRARRGASARWPTPWRPSCAQLGLEVDGGRQRRRDRLGRRQPARAHRRARGRAHDPALRPPRHGAARRPGRGGGARTACFSNRQRGDPRRRQQGGGRRDPGASRGGWSRGPRRWASSCCSRPARSSRCAGAKAFDRGRAAAPSSASCSTTPRRSAS